MDLREINVLVLAYLGDVIYEEYIRKYLISKNINNVDILQKTAVKFVKASSQSKFYLDMVQENFFTEAELSISKRARNHKGVSKPKSCTIIEYKNATALEALIGYLELENKKERIDEIINFIIRYDI